jgi:predicted nucleotidyltransferase
MRWHEPIDDILGSKLKVRILRLLFLTRGIYTGREIAKLARYSPTHTIAALKELEANGVIHRRHAGNADLYSLNGRSAVSAFVLSPIFGWEQNLFDQLAQLFKDSLGDDLVSIEIFGSVAGGDEDTRSDVDLLIVVKDDSDIERVEEKVAEVSVEAGSIFGNHISPILATMKDLSEKSSRGRGVWKQLSANTVTIYRA